MNDDNIFAYSGFVFCLEGEMKLQCNGNDLVLKQGMLCVFSPILFVEIVAESEGCRYMKLQLPLSNIFPQRQNVMMIVSRLRLDSSPCLTLTPEQQTFFVKRLTHIEEHRQVMQQSKDEVFRGLQQQSIALLEQQTLIEMLCVFYQNRHGELATEPTQQQTVAFQFIFSLANNYKRHRNVEHYAEEVNMSPTYFTRLFKRQTGRTPMEMIHLITCTAARNMLRQSNLSIKEIASELGFPEQFTFRKYFKKHVGMAPTEYREQLTKK